MDAPQTLANQWLQENAAVLDARRAWVDVHGTFGDRVRGWKRAYSPHQTTAEANDH